jgi:HAD superfamily hydrolase (TIGR01509 family)
MIKSILHARGTTRQLASDAWFSHITQGAYRAVIFDCDGTLVESSEVHFLAIRGAVRAQGYDMPRDWYQLRTGLDRLSIFADFRKTAEGSFDASLAAHQSIKEFISQSASVARIPETATLVARLRDHYPMAVGTNSESEVAAASLKSTGLADAFQYIVCISDGLAPKPAPDIFKRATNLLGHPPAQTLVFEDSNEGVRAALDAKLDVIQLVHC